MHRGRRLISLIAGSALVLLVACGDNDEGFSPELQQPGELSVTVSSGPQFPARGELVQEEDFIEHAARAWNYAAQLRISDHNAAHEEAAEVEEDPEVDRAVLDESRLVTGIEPSSLTGLGGEVQLLWAGWWTAESADLTGSRAELSEEEMEDLEAEGVPYVIFSQGGVYGGSYLLSTELQDAEDPDLWEMHDLRAWPWENDEDPGPLPFLPVGDWLLFGESAGAELYVRGVEPPGVGQVELEAGLFAPLGYF